ncbi:MULTISPECIES: GntR family transcriptional regulator [Paenibacillus sonchi group]|uniref:Transcriptional regulator n=1 Tax=Paenibacillus riograndensis TaxID=483937 RepID=A0A132TXT0_9BACL|nr:MULTISPECIES: GntR family transcriptional regulator [Paenibacillus sonchi group]KWX76165.1 transcriptional regulator [Paenibacillus riograndensis]KWX85539.1 transcriptional regulator [Paenibacillus riograndensis]MCE3202285.1 GntR family transcriptional regulator [Paenibacillus sonchi]
MSIKAEIMNTLKHEILTLALKPGTILSETALSERFQISRTPLRDVLKQLALESYTDIYPKKGNIVSYIDLESVEQITYLRSTLEKEILKDLSSQLLLTGVHELKDILERQKEAIGQNDIDSFLNQDDAFHRALYRLAGREFLWNLIQQSNVHYLRYRRLHMLKTEKLAGIWKEHQSLLELMVHKETAKIGPLIHHHLREDIHSLDFQENFSEYLKK